MSAESSLVEASNQLTADWIAATDLTQDTLISGYSGIDRTTR